MYLPFKIPLDFCISLTPHLSPILILRYWLDIRMGAVLRHREFTSFVEYLMQELGAALPTVRRSVLDLLDRLRELYIVTGMV